MNLSESGLPTGAKPWPEAPLYLGRYFVPPNQKIAPGMEGGEFRCAADERWGTVSAMRGTHCTPVGKIFWRMELVCLLRVLVSKQSKPQAHSN